MLLIIYRDSEKVNIRIKFCELYRYWFIWINFIFKIYYIIKFKYFCWVLIIYNGYCILGVVGMEDE